MNVCFVDTNIFIEVFARSGSKSEKSLKLLKSTSTLITNSYVLSEVEWVLRTAYKQNRSKISTYIKKILTSDVRIDNRKLLLLVLDFYEQNTVDWTDCLNMFLMKEDEIYEIYSYDKGLSKFDWIKRIEP